MSTGAIIAIAAGVVIVLILLALLMSRTRRKEKQTEARRQHVADAHRTEAENRNVRADLAEREAQRQRAEAELHETRAEMHERGLADEQLKGDEAAVESDDLASSGQASPRADERRR